MELLYLAIDRGTGERRSKTVMQNNLKTRLDGSLTLCNETGIDFNGVHYSPDASKGYLEFAVSTAFPAGITVYNQGIYPAVLARSYTSLKNQQINLEHSLAAHREQTGSTTDRIIGSVVDVALSSPTDGKITRDPAKTVGIVGIASIAKMAQNTAALLDAHIAGTRKLSVSMEAL
jgi:hypothetical protein